VFYRREAGLCIVQVHICAHGVYTCTWEGLRNAKHYQSLDIPFEQLLSRATKLMNQE
jgi:hypothetical protein